jgi:hypothetical protein
MMRVKHDKFGLGVCLEEFVSGSGQKVARVVFDIRQDEERIILLSALSESNAALPPAAKAKPVPKPRTKKKTDKISDELLVPSLDEGLRIVPDFASGYESRAENGHGE